MRPDLGRRATIACHSFLHSSIYQVDQNLRRRTDNLSHGLIPPVCVTAETALHFHTIRKSSAAVLILAIDNGKENTCH